MIRQILNRRFVLGQLAEIRIQLEAQTQEGRERRRSDTLPEGAENLSMDDYKTTLDLVSESLEKEEKASSGQIGFEQPEQDRRRGEEALHIDDISFVSRDPVIGNFQSALEAYFETRQPDALTELSAEDESRRRGSELSEAADLSLKGYQPKHGEDGRRVFDRFSITDPGWVNSALSMGIRLFKKKHEFIKKPAIPRPIADRTRILMVGDWGSGIPRAQKVSSEMRKVIEDGKAQGLQQHVIHLGDIYYSGWEREVRNRFLAHWPIRAGEADEISSWAVNANHEMYSGGHAYFQTLLGDNRFKGHKNDDGQNASMFSLVNGKWRILGLDTGWDEHKLKNPQPEWIRDQVHQAHQAGQRVMLLSHHQLFSAHEKGGEHMVAALGDLLASPMIHSWFWGHEHRSVLYQPHMNIACARLIGHGGVPVYQWKKQSDAVSSPATYEYRGRFRKGLEQWALFGFAVLDFDGPNIKVRYINEDGVEHHQETIS
jgi:hypothetical protein